jgi:hypothetical protein
VVRFRGVQRRLNPVEIGLPRRFQTQTLRRLHEGLGALCCERCKGRVFIRVRILHLGEGTHDGGAAFRAARIVKASVTRGGHETWSSQQFPIEWDKQPEMLTERTERPKAATSSEAPFYQ